MRKTGTRNWQDKIAGRPAVLLRGVIAGAQSARSNLQNGLWRLLRPFQRFTSARALSALGAMTPREGGSRAFGQNVRWLDKIIDVFAELDIDYNRSHSVYGGEGIGLHLVKTGREILEFCNEIEKELNRLGQPPEGIIRKEDIGPLLTSCWA